MLTASVFIGYLVITPSHYPQLDIFDTIITWQHVFYIKIRSLKVYTIRIACRLWKSVQSGFLQMALRSPTTHGLLSMIEETFTMFYVIKFYKLPLKVNLGPAPHSTLHKLLHRLRILPRHNVFSDCIRPFILEFYITR